MAPFRRFSFSAFFVFWLLFGVGGCGVPERDNPVDPRAGDQSRLDQGIQLIAVLEQVGPEEQRNRLFEFRYQVSAPDGKGGEVVLASGRMNLVGSQARAVVRGITPGPGRIFRVDAFDAGRVRTFSAQDTLDVEEGKLRTVQLALERLSGDLEITSELPPEIERLEVAVVVDGDTLRQTFRMDAAQETRLRDIPTGSDVQVVLRGWDAEDRVRLSRTVSTDVRSDLLARIVLSVEAGAVHVVARFPEYVPIVEIDRFSDEAGTFFRRSEDPDLPGPNEPIDFDVDRFLLHGFGPNGESVEFYCFDIRSNIPAPVYILVDRRGTPIPGQLPIFDLLPGQEGHSDLWRIHHVRITDRSFHPNTLTSYQALVEGRYEIEPTQDLMNCVMVPDGSKASLRFDPSTPSALQDGWYRDQIVKYFLFENPNGSVAIAFDGEKVSTPQMYAFLENDRDLVDGFALDEYGRTHNVLSVLPPGAGEKVDYSPLWLLRILRMSAFDLVGDLSTAGNQTSENLNAEFTDLHLNAPVVRIE